YAHCLLQLAVAITLSHANSARILDEVDTQPPFPSDLPQLSGLPPVVIDTPDLAPTTAATTFPSGQIPATGCRARDVGDANPPQPETQSPSNAATPVADVAPIPSPALVPPGSPATAAATGATVAVNADTHHQPPLSLFMHDILGGSHPSGRVVTGIIASSGASGVPFSKPNGGVFPITGGVPLMNGNNDAINNNNAPFLAGLNGVPLSNAGIQSNGNNYTLSGGGNALPFVTAGNLPPGATLQKLMFGSITVIDDELTEGHELGTAVIGRAQGFYLASSMDGTSQTMALTALLHDGDDYHEEDTISFFGVHRTASPESQLAVVGGTGKYENAKGYATIETVHHEDEHTTDGAETILQFSVYLSVSS
ncbi:LOW QUALITY PROTEIN: dirigent protein 24-like, partial [Malania oleifera]|uniref:LOW QUALITY PROTEIN: dirigent protein 24-like n=1 Tax=Malania oleifera TaxID=397392 RepID=UPI0025AE2C7A